MKLNIARISRVFSILISTSLFASPSGKTEEPFEKPNVIIIYVDDLGYNDLGCYGGTQIPTPNIDNLATQGVRFTSAYVTASLCAPSRFGLLTGCQQQRFGYFMNYQPPKFGFPTEAPLMPEVMQGNNYRTAAIGKWHLCSDEGHRPWEIGFDYHYGFLSGAHDYYDAKLGWKILDPILRNQEPVDSITYLTDDISEDAAEFIKRNHANPFFMYVAYNAPHFPIQAPQRYKNTFNYMPKERREYAGMVAALDDGVGLIMKTLTELGLDRNTLVIFSNDNGGERNGSSNAPLLGWKGDFYEGGIRVPYIIRWTGSIEGNRVFDKVVSTMDVFPTVLAAAGIEYSKSSMFDGVNLLPYLSGSNTASPHTMLHWNGGHAENGGAIRKGNYKLVDSRDGFRTQLPIKADGSYYYLFDLENDIGEENDLAEELPEIYNELVEEYEAWLSGLPKMVRQ